MFGGSKTNKTDFIKKLEFIREDSIKHGITAEQFRDIFLSGLIGKTVDGEVVSKVKPSRRGYRTLFVGVISIAFVAILTAYYFEIKSFKDVRWALESSPCVIENNELVIEMTRPRIKCQMCENLHEVPVVTDITQDQFKELYAYTSVPALIKEATSDWTAMSNFSYQFFKDLYQNTKGALQSVDEDCQFFPYKTDFDSLEEVFNMSDSRANFSEGETNWYIGWYVFSMALSMLIVVEYKKHTSFPKYLSL